MAYQLLACPVCNRSVQAATQPGETNLSVGLHTRRDGTGVLCEGTGHIPAPQGPQESHS